MAIDIPHFWFYLAELITPMLREGGIPMGQLFRWAESKTNPTQFVFGFFHSFHSFLFKSNTTLRGSCLFAGSQAIAMISKQKHLNIYSTAPCAGDMFERHLCLASSHWEWNRLEPILTPVDCRMEVLGLMACHCAFREICKPLVPQGQAGIMLVRILQVLCKEMVCLM